MSGKYVWVVDDDTSIAWVLEKSLSKAGFDVTIFEKAESALRAAGMKSARLPDVMLSDIRMGAMDGFALLNEIHQIMPSLPVIIMTAYGDLDSAVDAYKFGAFEYLTKPFDIKEMVGLVERARLQTSKDSQSAISNDKFTSAEQVMLGDSSAIQELFRVIGRLASSEMNILIRGESGSGKELVAQAIYRNSPRSTKPLIAINTAAIPGELLESELFGHEKGAFTGAHKRHIGRFEQANCGTLFLDEIGDMPAGLQTRLLRVLSEGKFFRVGGREEVQVDVRVIAATHQDLESLVKNGQFRGDLFHRLNVISVYSPALRERRGDIPLLLQHFMAKAANFAGIEAKHCTAEVLNFFQKYDWPGNVRELENMVNRLVVLSPSNTIQIEDIPVQINACLTQEKLWQQVLTADAANRLESGDSNLMGSIGSDFEVVMINVVMDYTNGHKQRAAELLGWGRNTLTRKLKQLNIQ